ncbi:MAG TPA: CDP-alcohol phosphatidyltransferase family protein [Solirubrobacteraceae bacterium]|nr:CDP-alcohol phosphatidyltransferase family protein [Solirubrobacteraceae bacterium]
MARRPLTFRRLSGLDRSAPPPRETLRDAPWRPWTIPNAITYVRFALVPVFLVLALSSDEGTDALPAIIFALVAWGDYADGIAARVTGQYSKLGALLDPVIDRALVLAGVIVVWHFETLPRWALAVLALREVVQLLYGQWALRHGIDLTVNWPGRAAVWPVMSAIFFALVGLETLAEVLLYLGIVLAVWATALYMREGSSST